MASVAQQQFSRTDTITFLPFDQARGALRVSIAPTPHDEPLESDRAIPFRPHFTEMGIQPTFNIHINVQKAVSDSGLAESELGAATFVRDPAAKRYQILSSWPIASVPSSWESPSPIRVSPGAEIGMFIFLKDERKVEPNKPHRAGSLLEKASIKIVPEFRSASFPIRIAPPSEFTRLELPSDSVWAVRFKSENVDAPAADVIEVLVNQKCAEVLEAADTRTVGACLISAIYSAIARGTLDRAKLPPKDSEGLLAGIHKKMKATYEIEDDTLLLRASNFKNSFVECASQSSMDLQRRLRGRK